MLYASYQAQEDLLAPWRSAAVAGGEVLRMLPVSLLEWPLARAALAASEIVPLTALSHTRRPFAIESVQVAGRSVAVHEEAVTGSGFGTLLHFAKTPHIDQPRVVLLAPLSGHFATLLRDTVRTMLPDHDLYITDWKNLAVDYGPAHAGTPAVTSPPNFKSGTGTMTGGWTFEASIGWQASR